MIIKCPECGKEISDKAASCPSCGCPSSVWSAKGEGQKEIRSVSAPVSYVDENTNIDAQEAERKELNELWKRGWRSHEFVINSPKPGADTTSIHCNNCGSLTNVFLKDMDRRGSLYLVKNYCPCKNCGHAVSRGYIIEETTQDSQSSERSVSPSNNVSNARRCPKCRGPMNVQTVSESEKPGCFTIFLYILLALTVLGLLIVIPLALRKKTTTTTYAVCQYCGYTTLLSEK